MTHQHRTELLHSAPLARTYAATHCLADSGGASCSWYHGYWQYFRLLGLVATPWKQESFFARALSLAAQERKRLSILISGTADYALLSVIAGTFRPLGIAFETTVVDHCQTPLFLNRWYGERHGLDIHTLHDDIVQVQPPTTFDLICTHGFLGFFSSPQRPQLFKRWHDLLAPGGMVITTTKVREEAGEQANVFDQPQTAGFIGTLRAALEQVGEGVRSSLPPDIESAALEYCRRYRSFPVSSYDTLVEQIEGSGLRIVSVSREENQTLSAAHPANPGAAGRYLLVLKRGSD